MYGLSCGLSPALGAVAALGGGMGALLLLGLLTVLSRRAADAGQLARRGAAAGPALSAAVAAPASSAEGQPRADDAAVAAAAAVALHLDGPGRTPGAEAAAAIAVALTLAGGATGTSGGAAPSAWKIAGRIAGLRPR